jgi:hypothetical protein
MPGMILHLPVMIAHLNFFTCKILIKAINYPYYIMDSFAMTNEEVSNVDIVPQGIQSIVAVLVVTYTGDGKKSFRYLS